MVVNPTVTNICEKSITVCFRHPNDETGALKTMVIKREKDYEHLFESLLQRGSAYNYLHIILDVLSYLDLMHQNILLSTEKNTVHPIIKIGELIQVKMLNGTKHVISVVDVDGQYEICGKYELVDNSLKHSFSKYEHIMQYVTELYEIIYPKTDVYILKLREEDMV